MKLRVNCELASWQVANNQKKNMVEVANMVNIRDAVAKTPLPGVDGIVVDSGSPAYGVMGIMFLFLLKFFAILGPIIKF